MDVDARVGEETVVITGSDQTAGAWNPQNSRIILSPSGTGRWSGALSVPTGTMLEFKLVILGGKQGPRWEEAIPNRKITPVRFSIKYTARFNEAGTVDKREASAPGGSAVQPLASSAPDAEETPQDPSAPAAEEAEAHARAIKRRDEIRAAIAAGDEVAKKAREESDGAAAQTQGYDKLLAHRTGLKAVLEYLKSQSAENSEKVAEQRAAARCLEEELAAVTKAAAAARVRIDSVRKDRAKAAAVGVAATHSADSQESSAEAAAAAATERQQAALLAAEKLQARSDARAAEAEAAAHEAKFRAENTRSLAEDCAVREAHRRSAEEQVQNAAAALALHQEEAIHRKSTLDVEVRCAQQRGAVAGSLRDLQRDELGGDCEEEFKALQGAATGLATDSQASIDEVLKRQTDTKRADEARTAELRAAWEEATMYFAECDRMVNSIKARVAEREQQARKAAALYAKNAAVAAAAKEEYDLLMARATGALARDAARCEAEATKARDSAMSARMQSTSSEAPLRHQEEGEALALERLKEAEERLSHALAQARASAKAVAHHQRLEDGVSGRRETKVRRPVPRNEGDQKVEKTDLLGSTLISSDSQDSDRLEPILESDTEDEEAEVAASPCRATTLTIVQKELAVVEAQIKIHVERQDAIRADASKRVSEWQEEKKTKLVSLHLADLAVTSAKEDMKASQNLRTSSPVSFFRGAK